MATMATVATMATMATVITSSIKVWNRNLHSCLQVHRRAPSKLDASSLRLPLSRAGFVQRGSQRKRRAAWHLSRLCDGSIGGGSIGARLGLCLSQCSDSSGSLCCTNVLHGDGCLVSCAAACIVDAALPTCLRIRSRLLPAPGTPHLWTLRPTLEWHPTQTYPKV
jgi:hypothetical protein